MIQSNINNISEFNLCLCFKTKPHTELFTWNWVWFAGKKTCRQNALTVSMVSHKDFVLTQSKGNSEINYNCSFILLWVELSFLKTMCMCMCIHSFIHSFIVEFLMINIDLWWFNSQTNVINFSHTAVMSYSTLFP